MTTGASSARTVGLEVQKTSNQAPGVVGWDVLCTEAAPGRPERR